ncbi:aromatic-ring-hydroxylating dioxygenase subunit beta [Mycetocola sp.]|uniref:aromatic-ring-hydroxylating dioxygenase subunit beta n=1 Tax=Mycetocola sp. TaxID=1871042 RepID=UPI00398A1458
MIETTDTTDLVTVRATMEQFLGTEARLLDEGDLEAWYLLLDDEIHYETPIRVSTELPKDEVIRGAFRIRDDKAAVRTRIDRYNTGIAYSEVPPSRTLRLVGSIEVRTTDEAGVYAVASALVLYRQRGIDTYFDLIPARRNDLIRITPAGARLQRREVILTETSLATPNLGLFL